MLKYILIFLIIFMLFYKYKIEKFDKERYSCGCSRNSCNYQKPEDCNFVFGCQWNYTLNKCEET